MNVTFVILLVLWLWKGGFTCYMYACMFVFGGKLVGVLRVFSLISFAKCLYVCLCIFVYMCVCSLAAAQY